MEWLTDYHLGGIVIGICTFLIIGLFHPIVVKAEYYWGTRCWWIFLILGIAGIIGSILINDILISSLIGVFSFSSFWTIKEIFEQRERVLKGWFPMNPKRKHEYEEKKTPIFRAFLIIFEIPGKYHSFCKDNFITIEKKILIIPLTVTLFAIFFVFL